KLRDIIPDQNAYVYSTSHTFCFPFRFMPLTTVAPINQDFSRAVSFMWQPPARHFLPQLHQDVYDAVQSYGLDWFYTASVRAFALGPAGRANALGMWARAAKQAGDEFPLSDLTLQCLRSFAPVNFPTSAQMEEARAFWSAVSVGQEPP